MQLGWSDTVQNLRGNAEHKRMHKQRSYVGIEVAAHHSISDAAAEAIGDASSIQHAPLSDNRPSWGITLRANGRCQCHEASSWMRGVGLHLDGRMEHPVDRNEGIQRDVADEFTHASRPRDVMLHCTLEKTLLGTERAIEACRREPRY